MIRLVTASPGSGKTCLVVEWLIKEVDKGFYKEFYTNIENLTIQGVRPLPPDGDWRLLNPDKDKNQPPKLVIIDEAQYFDAFMKENRSASNRIGKDLSTHRHYGIDIWFITQSTKLLNDYVLENVGEHVHLYRPNKRKDVQVYWWSYCQKSLTKTAFKDADDKQIWRLNPAMFDYYKSTSQVTDSKARTSQKFVTNMISAILLVIFIGYFGIYKGIGSLIDLKHDTTAKDKTAVTQDTSVLGVSPQIMPTELQQIPTQAQDQSQEMPEINKRIILDSRKKYLGEYTAEVADDDNIRPALVAKMGNQCKAYNKFGELLYIDDSLCNSMLVEVGVMPRSRQVFNDYLAQSQPPTTTPTTTAPPTLETTQPTPTSVQ